MYYYPRIINNIVALQGTQSNRNYTDSSAKKPIRIFAE